MSYVFDIAARAYDRLERHVPLKDDELKTRFRLFLDELHEANHRLKDAVNHDPAVRKKAEALEKCLDKLPPLN